MSTCGAAWRPIVLAIVALTGCSPASSVSPVGTNDRISQAATESVRLYRDWLGRSPADESSPTISMPWQAAPAAMEIESLVAYRIARRYWTESAASPEVARGLSWYLQSRVVEHLFNLGYAAPGHSADGLRLFGGFVPVSFPALRFSRWRALDVDAVHRRRPSDLDERGVRVALAFASLERYLGWPALQGALAVLAREHDVPLTPERANAVISAAAGQDLSWFFAIAFDASQHLDYGIGQFVTAPATTSCTTPCFTTRVTLQRTGSAIFSGASRDRVGAYEAGDGVVLQVLFDDGQVATSTWDGRDETRNFEFVSAAPAASVRVDPEGTLLLDSDTQDHVRLRDPQTNVPIVKWLARWSVWLQHAMMSYAMLV
jgi:hypothetical protein